jgi:hypothetical protein
MRPPTLATLALLLLALLFGWETRQALLGAPGGRDNDAISPVGSWQPGVPASDPSSLPDPAPAASAIAARPLFRPDRLPYREQAVGAFVRNYEADLSRYTLIGVLGFGEEPVGVVAGIAGGGKGERWEVKRGDLFQGFAVKEVGMEGVRLTADGKEFLLPLYAGAPTVAVRTEATRRDAAQPGSVPRAGAPASAMGTAPPGTGVPPSSPLAGRMRRSPSVPMAPGVTRTPSPSDMPPAAAPGTIPGVR